MKNNLTEKEHTLLIEKLGGEMMTMTKANTKHNKPLYAKIRKLKDDLEVLKTKLRSRDNVDKLMQDYCIKHGLKLSGVKRIFKDIEQEAIKQS